MAEYIGCRNCGSSNCKGCNIYTLATMLENGKFDCLMNGNRSINPAADVVEVVRCKDCKISRPSEFDDGWRFCFNNQMHHQGCHFCSYGERKEAE